MISKEWGR